MFSHEGKRKTIHIVQMTDGKCSIIHQLLSGIRYPVRRRHTGCAQGPVWRHNQRNDGTEMGEHLGYEKKSWSERYFNICADGSVVSRRQSQQRIQILNINAVLCFKYNIIKYVADKDRKLFFAELKTIYQALTDERVLEVGRYFPSFQVFRDIQKSHLHVQCN